MPLYIADYLADTSRLSTEQHGAYMLLIMDYWRNGQPPDDDEVLASIVKLPVKQWQKHRPLIAPKFSVLNGKWVHKRIEEEKQKAESISSKRSAAGKHGADKRHAKVVSIV